MKQKLLPILLIVVIVTNFILCNSVYADKDQPQTSRERYGGNEVVDPESTRGIIENGKDSMGNEFKHSKFGSSIVGVALQYVATIINSLPLALQGIMSLLTMNPKDPGEDDGFLEQTVDIANALYDLEYHFTIDKTVFNEISMFNINVFNMSDTYEIGIDETETINQSQALLKLKESTAGWFYTCRTLAMMLNAIVLLYVGIRMALASVASEEAKYKKMLIDWAVSMLIVFILPYLMAFILSLGQIMINILYTIRKTMVDNGAVSFEDTILQSIYWAFENEGGMRLFMYSLFFWFLTFIQGKFFFTYFKRMLTVFFLVIISPFITVTYPIDKMGDGKAQAFDSWMKQFIINVLIQPIHAATYLVFVFTAGKIAEKQPFVAMIFLLTLGRIENIVRNIFGLTDSTTLKNIEMRRKKKK